MRRICCLLFPLSALVGLAAGCGDQAGQKSANPAPPPMQGPTTPTWRMPPLPPPPPSNGARPVPQKPV